MGAYGAGAYGAGPYGFGASTGDAQLTYTVELDLSGSSFGTAFSATDVTSKAVAGMGFDPVTITWGRQDQFSDVNPTTVSGSLLNTDGRFTPGNASGIYYPKIRRGLRRRVSVGVNSATLVLAEDYATSIEVVPQQDAPALTQIEGVDILGRFGGTASTPDPTAPSIGTTMRPLLAEETLVQSPTCLFMMQEADGATSFADILGAGGPLTVVNSKYGAGTVTAGQEANGTFYGGTVIDITNANYGTTTRGGSWLAGTVPAFGSTFSAEVWVQMPAANPASTSATILAFGNGSNAQLTVNTSGQLVWGGASTATHPSYCDGRLHQIVLSYSAGTGTITMDGNSYSASAVFTPSMGTALTVGMQDDGLGGTKPFTGAVAYLSIFPTDMSTWANAHYTAGVTANAGERTDVRITRLLSYRPGISLSADAPGLSTMGVQDIAGRSLQDCILEAVQVESGAAFVYAGAGVTVLRFRPRSAQFNPAAAATFDMSKGGVNFGSNWREDTQNVVNDVTITNETTGSDQRFYDATSITQDGEYSTSTQLPVNADTDALNLAGWMVANGTQPQLTATPIIIDLLHITATQAQAALSLQPLDVIQITNCPTPAPAATMSFVVQGGTTVLGADEATVTLNLTPYPYPVGVWDTTTWDATGVTWAF